MFTVEAFCVCSLMLELNGNIDIMSKYGLLLMSSEPLIQDIVIRLTLQRDACYNEMLDTLGMCEPRKNLLISYLNTEIVRMLKSLLEPVDGLDEFARIKSARVVTLEFDSYMVQEEDIVEGDLRLLEVDKALHLPSGVQIRMNFTSVDVIHSWAVPSFGIKTDCVPGRLNQSAVFITKEGVAYGQCSELCGVNHGFMPIVVVIH